MAELPPPTCKCFVLCRGLFVDPVRQDFTLVAPVHQVFAPHYPLIEDLSVFARWSNAHGAYTVEVQLRTLDGHVLWRHRMERPFEVHNPLQVWILTLPHLSIPLAAPGKYEVALLANGQEVASDVLLAHHVTPAARSER